jgi:DNA-binding winged helix-turn-helix (wHTH) protein
MESSSASPNALRFGLYEVDLAAGELRKRGRKVVLQEQPFKLLTLLLRRPGEVVTREELQQALWPTDTFVEFDESLNKAVQKLRQALGDSSDNPHLIETVPRRGYRFITPVEPIRQDTPDQQAEEPHAPEPEKANTLSSTTARRPPRERILWTVALAAAMGIIFTLWIRWPVPPPAQLRKYRLSPEGGFCSPVISPDGQQIAYTAQGSVKQTDQPTGAASVKRLWIRNLNREEPREIVGTQGAYAPFWSPDSALVGFAVKNQLWKAPAQGGGPSAVCEISDLLLGGTWSHDGRTIIFSIHHQGIYEVPAGGGVPKMLIPVDRSAAGNHFDDPYLLP